jgi:hypothetical protein
MKTYGDVEIQHHAILTSVLDGDEWSTCNGRFNPGEKSPGTPRMGDKMGTDGGLLVMARRNISVWEWSPLHSHYTD